MKPRKQRREKEQSLFTRGVWKVLTKRERELSSGRGVEIRTLEELRKQIRSSKSKRVAATSH